MCVYCITEVNVLYTCLPAGLKKTVILLQSAMADENQSANANNDTASHGELIKYKSILVHFRRVGLKSDGTLSPPRICKPLYGPSQGVNDFGTL